ncbi:MAG: YggT family protein [Gammaproteobacteria bacterium]
MSNPLIDAGSFLVQTIFSFFILLLMLRLLLQALRADFYNPISQFIVKMTSPLVKPFQRVIPKTTRINVAVILVMLILQMCAIFLLLWLNNRGMPNLLGLSLWALAQLLSLLVDVFFYAILIMVVLSWIAPNLYNPVVSLLYQITEPLLAPARRLIPPISGFDISPIIVIVLLKLTTILLINPLANLGTLFALSG